MIGSHDTLESDICSTSGLHSSSVIDEGQPARKLWQVLYRGYSQWQFCGILTSFCSNSGTHVQQRSLVVNDHDCICSITHCVQGFLQKGAFSTLCHDRSEEHTSELQSLMRISYAV